MQLRAGLLERELAGGLLELVALRARLVAGLGQLQPERSSSSIACISSSVFWVSSSAAALLERPRHRVERAAEAPDLVAAALRDGHVELAARATRDAAAASRPTGITIRRAT